ncbi:MAG: TetR/AcrR family transcriptional regulator [Acidimicrobiales bacterium]|nr:TetR/AcrR family transcriptional regulator [Acidimicrobiales bacterium]
MNEEATSQRRSAGESSSETQRALLRAARDCLAELGLAKTTSRTIANRAEANLASITYYFGSKDALIAEALFGELEARLSPVLDALEGSAGDAAQGLGAALEALVADFGSSRDQLPVFIQALVASGDGGPLGDRARVLLGSLQARLAELIGRLKQQGVAASWVEPDAMAALIIAVCNGVALQAMIRHDTDISVLAAQFGGLLLASSVDADQ